LAQFVETIGMDSIFIKDLLVRAIIGINDDEREKKQDVLINVVLWTDLEKAGRTDDLEDTVNYRSIKKRIYRLVESSQYKLVEALAGAVADVCFEDAKVCRVRVAIEKPGALRFARSVGVEITRERS